MTIAEIKEAVETAEALHFILKAIRIKNYLNGKHKVLERKDFNFKNEILTTSKIVLQTIKSIIDFHTSYLVGNAVTLSGENHIVKLYNDVYKRGGYGLVDYNIVDNLTKYGNAYEYVYIEDGTIKSKVIDNLDSYPIYDDRGNYIAFIEFWHDVFTNNCYYTLYEPETVTEYATDDTGDVIQVSTHNNATGLPIHYTSGVESAYSLYGEGIIIDLIPIVDEIEQLLSKTTDAVTTLSLNPLGVSSGQKIDSSVDKNIVGVVLNLEDGGAFNYASATIDSLTVKMLVSELINQLYAVAQVPSVVFNGNVSNVSEVSLKLLFTQLDNKAKRTAKHLESGFKKRFAKIYTLLTQKPSKTSLDSLDVVFNYNRPTDNTAIINDLCKQREAGALSIKSFIEHSPYTTNADVEMGRIKEEISNTI